MRERSQNTEVPQGESTRTIVLRGLSFIPLFYAIVQAEQWLVGKPFEWFGELHFLIAVFMPVVIVSGELILQRRRNNERPKR